MKRTKAAASAMFALAGTLTFMPGRATAQVSAVTFPGPQGVVLRATLFHPAGVGPFPAVVALHGCGGLNNPNGALNARHADWGERLSAQGFLVLMPDSFGSRGAGSQCATHERSIRPGRERTADAYAAKAYLQGRSDVKPQAVSLLGWSHGGSTVLYAVAASAHGSDGAPPFARAVAFYPGCRRPAEQDWHDKVPLEILVGGADDWTGAEDCRVLAARAQARGEPVAIRVYPGAYHDFDHPNLPVRERRGLAYTAGENGVAHVGTDPAARTDALARVPGFFAR